MRVKLASRLAMLIKKKKIACPGAVLYIVGWGIKNEIEWYIWIVFGSTNKKVISEKRRFSAENCIKSTLALL